MIIISMNLFLLTKVALVKMEYSRVLKLYNNQLSMGERFGYWSSLTIDAKDQLFIHLAISIGIR